MQLAARAGAVGCVEEAAVEPAAVSHSTAVTTARCRGMERGRSVALRNLRKCGSEGFRMAGT